MEPASTIIDRLGGSTIVAHAIGIHRTRVANWKRPKASGGTDGRIPQWHVPRLIAFGATCGVDLRPEDFSWPAAKPNIAEPEPAIHRNDDTASRLTAAE